MLKRCFLTSVLLFSGAMLVALTPDGAIRKLKAGTVVKLEGIYKRHAQGTASDGTHVFWVMSDCIVKTDVGGKVIKVVPVTYHAGDPCWHKGRLYVPVCVSGFNKWLKDKPSRNWIYIFDGNLKYLSRKAVPEAEFGAGAIEFRSGRFYIAGGRPAGLAGNEVLEYDAKFRFQRKIPVDFDSVAGIQSINWDGKYWWLGYYGRKRSFTVLTDRDFKVLRTYDVVASYGNIPLGGNRLFSVYHKFTKDKRSLAEARIVTVDLPESGKSTVPAGEKNAK